MYSWDYWSATVRDVDPFTVADQDVRGTVGHPDRRRATAHIATDVPTLLQRVSTGGMVTTKGTGYVEAARALCVREVKAAFPTGQVPSPCPQSAQRHRGTLDRPTGELSAWCRGVTPAPGGACCNGPMPATHPSTPRPVAVVRGLYPWADLVLDTAVGKRKAFLPEALSAPVRIYEDTARKPITGDRTVSGPSAAPSSGLPAHLTGDPAGTSSPGWVRVHRVEAGEWGRAGRVHMVIVTSPPDTEFRTAVVVEQSGRAAPDRVVASVLVERRGRYLFSRTDEQDPDPWRAQQNERYLSESLADWYTDITDVTAWLTSGPPSGEAGRWSATKLVDWMKWFSAGVLTAEDRATLEAAGVGAPHNHALGSVSALLDAGMSIDEIVNWVPYLGMNGPHAVKTVFGHGLRFADVAPYLGTTLDPTDTCTDWQETVARVEEIRRAINGGWTSQGRRAIDASAPEGCSSTAWADLWAAFMPIELASAYAAAGFRLVEAARLHARGEDPPTETLATMAALRTDPLS